MPNTLPPLAIHVDLDGVHQIFRAHSRAYSGTGDPIFASGMENMLRLFDAQNIRATLFVIAEDLRDPAKRALLAQAIARGHAVGSHTISHTNLLRASRAEKEHQIAASKKLIEDTLGAPVTGFRAPGYAIDAEALQMVAAAGYVFDSSVFPTPLFEQRLGLTHAQLQRPLQLGAYGGLIELPLPGPMPLGSPIGPSFALAFGPAAFYWAMARAAKRDGGSAPTVLLFHLIDFAAPLERQHRGGAKMSLFTLSTRSERAKEAACQGMLRFVARRFRLTDTAELLSPFGTGATALVAS
ncbi:MAG: polysaccharide deacetylase family protein [Gemmatimonadota bacterium]